MLAWDDTPTFQPPAVPLPGLQPVAPAARPVASAAPIAAVPAAPDMRRVNAADKRIIIFDIFGSNINQTQCFNNFYFKLTN